MKKRVIAVLAALLVVMASGCGGQTGGKTSPSVDLTALYAAMAESCGWDEDYMADIEGELLEEYYPGLSGIETPQRVVKVPAMSSDVNEIVLLQCGTEEDAEKAVEILQARIDTQVDGGAWYAETLESWRKAKVLRQGVYAALIASGEFQESLEGQFNEQFG